MENYTIWQDPECSLYLNPNDDSLDFDNRNLDANDNYSGGVFVLRKCLYLKTKISSSHQTFYQCLAAYFGEQGIFSDQECPILSIAE